MIIPKKNPLEWAVFAISLALLLSILGYLIYDSLQDEGTPAQISIELGQPESEGSLFRVPVTVTNNGDDSAADVEVGVTDGSQELSLTIALLPSRSTASGYVYFQKQPEPGSIAGRVLSYLEP